MSFGVMGGEYQAFGYMQFLTRLFDYGMDVQEAQDMPRFFPDPFSDVVEVEELITNEMRDALQALGHDIQPAYKSIGGSQAIFIDWETDLLIADRIRVKTAAQWAINDYAVFLNIQHDMDIIHSVSGRIGSNLIAVSSIEIINDLVGFGHGSLIKAVRNTALDHDRMVGIRLSA